MALQFIALIYEIIPMDPRKYLLRKWDWGMMTGGCQPYLLRRCLDREWYWYWYWHVGISSGWWYTYPSEKWWSSSVGIILPNWMEKQKFMFQTTNRSCFFFEITHSLVISKKPVAPISGPPVHDFDRGPKQGRRSPDAGQDGSLRDNIFVFEWFLFPLYIYIYVYIDVTSPHFYLSEWTSSVEAVD